LEEVQKKSWSMDVYLQS